MLAEIIDRGRGPEIAGTRITVLDVYDYTSAGWDDRRIGELLKLSDDQVRAARRYIAEHPAEVEAAMKVVRERAARGNPPEILARLDASRARLRAMLKARTATASGDGHAPLDG